MTHVRPKLPNYKVAVHEEGSSPIFLTFWGNPLTSTHVANALTLGLVEAGYKHNRVNYGKFRKMASTLVSIFPLF